ncbi:curli production assembly protein CsgF [Parashewanella spongiae]|uniref:Curli production assembly/transport component CsgF n=1 Tax=Parashewanella spongiae TaxID=342950 RepID=A0A3A6TWR3_9GAMM|nr:curli assembly protein CsgF [Parashewanella spongiae]MCL1078737.1 curli assembly protein CsgF [Parashewanella spongiae]RJY17482.1 curli production assembly protein CsgF [Parashewanella spongiae]
MKKIIFAGLVLSCTLAPQSFSTELIYTPINPTFGGNPLNGSLLLAKANAQNDNSESQERDFVQRFKESLERNILSKITRGISSGELTEGRFVTGDHTIVVADLGEGHFEISITNDITGEVTVIEIYNPENLSGQ